MKVSMVDMGLGGGKTLTAQAQQALAGDDAVLGAPRLLEGLPKREGVQYLPLSLPEEVARQVRQHPEWERGCVALSGDVGFYSGAARLTALLEEVGLGASRVTVGENPGGEDERVFSGTAEELAGQTFASLSVALVENKARFTRSEVSPGLADEAFVRGGVPMTKREVRLNILAMLVAFSHLRDNGQPPGRGGPVPGRRLPGALRPRTGPEQGDARRGRGTR